jgi:hypothetical protein
MQKSHWSATLVCVSYNLKRLFTLKKPRGRGVKPPTEPLPGRKTGPADHCSSSIFLFVLHSRRGRDEGASRLQCNACTTGSFCV